VPLRRLEQQPSSSGDRKVRWCSKRPRRTGPGMRNKTERCECFFNLRSIDRSRVQARKFYIGTKIAIGNESPDNGPLASWRLRRISRDGDGQILPWKESARLEFELTRFSLHMAHDGVPAFLAFEGSFFRKEEKGRQVDQWQRLCLLLSVRTPRRMASRMLQRSESWRHPDADVLGGWEEQGYIPDSSYQCLARMLHRPREQSTPKSIDA